MSLVARIELRLGTLELDVDLRVATNEVAAVLGPNGAGKTTLFRALSGLLTMDRGRIELDGQVLDDPEAGIHVETSDRPIGVVFQDYLLFAHMSALDNVAFGLRARGMPRKDARASAARWLDRVGLAQFAGAKPRALSGGQAQRVALARAMATEPKLLLLDEPLAALDAAARVSMRSELRTQLARFPGTRLIVTHDPLDAMVLAERLIVLEHGRITHDGNAAQLTARPRSRYVAELVGLNLWHGTARGTVVALRDGGSLTLAEPMSGHVVVTVSPHAVVVDLDEPTSSARNVWSTTVDSVEAIGDRVRVRLEGSPSVVAEVTPAAVAELRLDRGQHVWAAVKATELTAYPETDAGAG
jgi:molybdate transport system ATP-binding protein